MLTRNLAIDWMKGVMILIIVLHHYFLIPFFRHTYLPVDFFFCISGYYLLTHFKKGTDNALVYTTKRFIKFFPALLILFVFSCIILHDRIDISSFEAFVQTIGSFSFLLTMTNGLMIDTPTAILDITWFTSILIIAGYFIYALLSYNSRLSITILLPAFIVFGYSLFFSHNSSLTEGSVIYGLNLTLVRGACDMAIGVLLCEIYHTHQDAINQHSIMVNILAILALVFFLAIMCSEKCFDSYSIIALPFIVMGLIHEKSWLQLLLSHFKKSLFILAGTCSYEILLSHQLIMIVLYKVLEITKISLPLCVLLLVDIVLVISFSYLLHKLLQTWKRSPATLQTK